MSSTKKRRGLVIGSRSAESVKAKGASTDADKTRRAAIAPHPFGGSYGPAGIREVRQAPLLAGSIVRLLQRHGVPWKQAIREAAGLMAQTIEETENWWAFETCHRDSPTDAKMIAAMRSAPDEPSDTARIEWLQSEQAKVKWPRDRPGNRRSAQVESPRTIGHACELRDAIDEAMYHASRAAAAPGRADD